MQKVNIFADKWIDIVFEGRNKEYGAYALRKLSSKRHRFSLIATIIFALVAFTAPGLIETIIPERVERNVEVTNLANIELEKNKVKEIEVPIEIEKQEVLKIKSTIKFTAPVIKDDALVKDEDMMKTQEEVTESKLSVSAADVQGNSTSDSAVDISDLQLDQSEVTDEAYEKPFTIVEQMPEFPGGAASMMKYIATNVKYPAMARETGISGNVFVSFVVNRKGEIKDVKVLRGIGGGCDEEAIRVVMSMPNWIPGKQNGKPVPVQFNLPIKFILK
ncbi:MAG: energy transducer TonB [Bacteroidales bacterium]|jgi:protein TonB|nr:energy transducer TonB [Bacteroidales bacterium]